MRNTNEKNVLVLCRGNSWRFVVTLCMMLLSHADWVDSFSIIAGRNGSIRLETIPLKGGPKWLPLHVKVVMDEKAVFDYVPVNATSSATLKKLVSLQPVPALTRVRIREITSQDSSNGVKYQYVKENLKDMEMIPSSSIIHVNDDAALPTETEELLTRYTQRAREFCEGYNKDLHLIFNNCWVFAFEMVMHVLKEEHMEQDRRYQQPQQQQIQ